MKRDLGLFREILLIMEEVQPSGSCDHRVQQGLWSLEQSDAVITGHLELMRDAGLIEVEIEPILGDEIMVGGFRIKNLGHDFLEASRQRKRLDEFLSWAKRHGIPLTVQVFLDWARRSMAGE